MIIGLQGTPYEKGFFFFDIEFTKKYPPEPPKVKFITGDGNTRFNPNLYIKGKVCLSILELGRVLLGRVHKIYQLFYYQFSHF